MARQALPGEFTSPAFAFASLVAWLWWLPVYLRQAGRSAAPAILGGLVLTVAGQAALHGLDVHVLTGLPGLLAGVALGGLFAASVWRTRAEPEHRGGAWGAAVLWPYLFLQLTLLINLGRLQVTSGWDLLQVATLSVVALLAGLAVLSIPIDRRLALALAALAVLLLLPGEWMVGWSALALVPIQVGLALGLRAAFELPGQRTHLAFVGGSLVFFVLLFVYYSSRDVPSLLWPLAALGCAASLLRTSAHPTARRPLAAAGTVAILGLGLSLVPYTGGGGAQSTGQPPDQLKILDYNIHQALDYYSVPSASALADVIQAADADVVGLQEVNRGWNISGGVDYAAWLQWRLPAYHVVYGPMQTQLFGGLILSKYPITASGWQRYPPGQSTNTRGFVWAAIASSHGDITFVTTHLTPYTGFDQDRADQAAALEQFWAKRPRFILTGDFNAEPDDAAIRTLQAAGLQDVGATLGLGQTPTYSSGEPDQRIDYVFASQDVHPVTAAVPHTLASDHLPVTATVGVE